MKKNLVVGILTLLTTFNSSAQITESTLSPKSHFGQEATLASQILDTYHFRKINLNDSLSAVILQGYIETLDNNKSYFLKSDIEEFSVYQDKLDDLTNSSSVKPAYVIYDVFR